MQITVVIPYYQREKGILGRAVESVVSQVGIYERDDVRLVSLIVVDDESPVPASEEVTEGELMPGLVCQITRQSNRGPGGARNTGIDAAADSGLIAFLDSDDEWLPNHLERAFTALTSGFDVYGSNWIPLGEDADALSMPVRRSLKLASAEVLDEAGEISGDPLISEMTAPMCKLSGLVYRADRFPGLRFDTRFRNASEDVLFIYTMMLMKPRVLISRSVEVRSGRGVNVYESAEWGTLKKFDVIHDQTLAARLALSLVRERPDAVRIVRRNLAALRRSFAGNVWHLLLRGSLPSRAMFRQLRLDTASIWAVAYYPIRRLLPARQQ